MDTNEIKLSIEFNNLIKRIILKQNIELIRQIAKDYNRNENNLLYKFLKGEYN